MISYFRFLLRIICLSVFFCLRLMCMDFIHLFHLMNKIIFLIKKKKTCAFIFIKSFCSCNTTQKVHYNAREAAELVHTCTWASARHL